MLGIEPTIHISELYLWANSWAFYLFTGAWLGIKNKTLDLKLIQEISVWVTRNHSCFGGRGEDKGEKKRLRGGRDIKGICWGTQGLGRKHLEQFTIHQGTELRKDFCRKNLVPRIPAESALPPPPANQVYLWTVGPVKANFLALEPKHIKSYQVQYICQVELEQKITFKELPVVRSEFHQHFGAGATMQRIYQWVSGGSKSRV